MKKLFFLLFFSVLMLYNSTAVFAVPENEDDVYSSDTETDSQQVSALPNGKAVYASAAVVIDAISGEVLFARNEDDRLTMASTTKIMTSIIALESGDIDKEYTIEEDMIRVEGTSMGLVAGDKLTMRDLVYGMLLPSGNDAANAVAILLGGSKEGFAKLMNEKASELGMENTNYVNPEGLTEEGHYTTANDLAILASYALKNDTFREICSTKTTKRTFGNPPVDHYYYNHNKLVRYSMYEGIIGVKTGYTSLAGRCLVSAAERNGVRIVCVTLNDPNDWNDHINMLDYGFSLYNPIAPDTDLGGMLVPVVGGMESTVKAACADSADIYLTDSEKKFVVKRVKAKRFIYAPVNAGDEIGTVEYVYNGNVVSSIPIVAENSVQSKDAGWFSDLVSAITCASELQEGTQ